MIVTLLDTRALFEAIASVSGAIALWASSRAARENDPVHELTARLRRPARWTLAHPLRALRRLTGGR